MLETLASFDLAIFLNSQEWVQYHLPQLRMRQSELKTFGPDFKWNVIVSGRSCIFFLWDMTRGFPAALPVSPSSAGLLGELSVCFAFVCNARQK